MPTTSTPAMDRVLSCTSLPSLPGVAMRVLELTRDRNVSMNALAEAVQTDPALATKVLKTVNSSYYGLATPCPSIPRAMSMLGLNTVKSIVLGFSLVDFTKALGGAEARFDFTAYWRRAVFSAAGARAIARETRKGDPEEAFVAALVADIGMLAALAALKDEYLAGIGGAEDHDDTIKLERERLGFDHAEIGGTLAERWRLPPQLAACVAYHHNEAACPPEHMDLVRVIVLGRLAAAALTVANPKPKLGALIQRGNEWFELSRDQVKKLLEVANAGGTELGKVLDVRTGASADLAGILSQAQEQLVQQQVELQQESQQLKAQNETLTKKTVTDALTQAFNRAYFDESSERLFNECKAQGQPFAIVFLDGDRFKSINDTHGHQAGDGVLRELAKRAKHAVSSAGGFVCRYGGEEFAIILPKIDLSTGAKIADKVRVAMEASPFDLTPYGVSLTLPVTVSVGVSAWEFHSTGEGNAASITHAADQAVYAAKKSGRNRTCLCKVGGTPQNIDGSQVKITEPAAAAPAKPATLNVEPAPGAKPAAASAKPTATPVPNGAPKRPLLIVEDDPLAAKLLELLFAKRGDFSITIATSAEKAIEHISNPGKPRPCAVIADYNLPGITGLNLSKLIGARGGDPMPVVIVTAAPDEQIKKLAMAGGAAHFMNKADLCTNFEGAIEAINRVIAQHALAGAKAA
jgi:two-component system, cell cycle response regulator